MANNKSSVIKFKNFEFGIKGNKLVSNTLKNIGPDATKTTIEMAKKVAEHKLGTSLVSKAAKSPRNLDASRSL